MKPSLREARNRRFTNSPQRVGDGQSSSDRCHPRRCAKYLEGQVRRDGNGQTEIWAPIALCQEEYAFSFAVAAMTTTIITTAPATRSGMGFLTRESSGTLSHLALRKEAGNMSVLHSSGRLQVSPIC